MGSALNDNHVDLQRVEGIVFDLDGTLVDSYAAIAESLNHARDRFDLPPLAEEYVRGLVGHGLESLIAEHVGHDRVETGVALFRERYREVYLDRSCILDGVACALETLHEAGFALSVASNKPARFSTPILERHGLRTLFRCVEGPDLALSHKPEPTMIRRCLQQMGVTERNALYVGDMVLDVESGDRAGVPVVLVRGGSSDDEALRSTGRLVVDSLGELARRLQDVVA